MILLLLRTNWWWITKTTLRFKEWQTNPKLNGNDTPFIWDLKEINVLVILLPLMIVTEYFKFWKVGEVCVGYCENCRRKKRIIKGSKNNNKKVYYDFDVAPIKLIMFINFLQSKLWHILLTHFPFKKMESELILKNFLSYLSNAFINHHISLVWWSSSCVIEPWRWRWRWR